MARGQVFTIPSGTNVTVATQSREEKRSFVVINPNDGVCYFKLNGGANPSPGGWDWKLPSQSAGAFGGPWQSLGVYFLDQSGAGRSGEINLFDADNDVQIPNIWAIGRALQAQVGTVDITQGLQPTNPPTGITRLWSDNTGLLYALLAGGTSSEINKWITLYTAQLNADVAVPVGVVTTILTLSVPTPGLYLTMAEVSLSNTGVVNGNSPDIRFEDQVSFTIARNQTINAGEYVSFDWFRFLDYTAVAAGTRTLAISAFSGISLNAKARSVNSTLVMCDIQALKVG